MLVQISEPAKGKSRQVDGILGSGPIGTGLGTAIADLGSAIGNKVKSAFDSANQEAVKTAIGPLFEPSAVPQPTNIGNTNTGNTG